MMNEPIQITVLDSATIFDGPQHIYRYDLPGSGIVAGWAVSAVVDQIKTIAGNQWPDIEVAIKGDDRAVEMLTRTLLNKGIGAYPMSVVEEARDREELEIVRPTRGKKHGAAGRITPFHGVVAAVILTVVALSWWGLGSAPEATTAARVSTFPSPVSTSPESPPSVAGKSPGSVTPTPGPVGVLVEFDRIRMHLPPDFTLAPRADGKLVAMGPDPNLRILVAVDPIHGVEPAAVNKEVELMVARDTALSPMASEKLRGETKTVDYHENPGDGSNVHWVTWVEHGHQFSIGCHSRREITLPHRAVCRMAAESVQLKN